MKTNQNCINCIHNKVCKLKQKYQQYDDFIYSHLDEIESDENFDYDLHIRCNEFTVIPDTPSFKDFNHNPIFVPTYPINDSNDCSNCQFFKTLMQDGTYIGDSPCTWCHKNQFNCTSDTATSTNKSNSKQILHS